MTNKSLILGVVTALFAISLGFLSSTAARADSILVASLRSSSGVASTGTVGLYTTLGAPVSPDLISGLNEPSDLEVVGSHLFVVNYGQTFFGSVGEYTTLGVPVNPALISGLYASIGIAVSGSDLFIAHFGNAAPGARVGKYTTSGTTLNPDLITGLNGANGIAISGSHLFVSSYGAGTIGEYTTSGVPVNPDLITGLNGPAGIAISGSHLFVASSSGVGEYTTSGVPVNPDLITGFGFSPQGITVSGSHLFVTYTIAGTIGEYTTSGVPVNPHLISGLTLPFATAIVRGPSPVTTPINENFDEIPPANVNTASGPVGPFFTGTNFRILGRLPPPGVGGATCRAPTSGNCLVLNGTSGVLTSLVALEPGEYRLSFDAIGNINATTGVNDVTVTLGPNGSGSLYDQSFMLGQHNTTSGIVSQLITVSTPEIVDLRFTSTGTLGANGTVLDNIRLAAQVPEPATLGLTVLGLLGGAVAGFARRERN
jgi:hypothetical protein